MSPSKNIIIIGGGAAGFFAAVNIAMHKPGYKVTILEKTSKLLSKVKVSGGGRCNVTHHCFDITELVKNYPRGSKELRQVFSRFNVQDTINWFGQQNVKLKTEEDGRMFPVTDNSQTIIDCFLDLSRKYKINIITSCEVSSISKHDNFFILKTGNGEMKADAVICSTGGFNKAGAYEFFKRLGHTIVDPIPSLFTINLPQEKIKKELQGISVQHAEVRIAGSKLNYHGPVLVTHWGLSGPAVLKLSAFAAEKFHEDDYNENILVNWISPIKVHEAEEQLKLVQKEKSRALPSNFPQFKLPKRLWEFLCSEAGADEAQSWANVSNKNISRLAELLCNSTYKMQGKTTFKEEFVTCGGVSLKDVDFKTMQSKIVPGLFFCGEVLNIDGITGGFNFQNAWSTAWICAQSV